MKKLLLLAVLLSFTGAGWAKKPDVPLSYQIAEAVAKSNYKTVKKLLPKLVDNNKQTRLRKHLFYMASTVCAPNVKEIYCDSVDCQRHFPKVMTPVCKKEENAKIIQLFLADNNKDDATLVARIKFEDKQPDGIGYVQFLTPLTFLKQSQPDLIPQIADQLDPCIVALTQMQELTPDEPYYWSYADFFRDFGCTVSDDDYIELESLHPDSAGFALFGNSSFDFGYNLSHDELRKYDAMLLRFGFSKAKLTEQLGTPTYYKKLSDEREELTFRRLHDEGYKYSLWDEIYLLDRDVVTHVKYKIFIGFLLNENLYEQPEDLTKYETEERGY